MQDKKNDKKDKQDEGKSEFDYSMMSFNEQRQLKFIDQLPKLVWPLIALVALVVLMPKISALVKKAKTVKVFDIEIELKSSFDDYNNSRQIVDSISKLRTERIRESLGERESYIPTRNQERIISRVNRLEDDFATNNYKLLWVDDHPSNNVYVARILQLIGFKIEHAGSTQSAIELLQLTIADTSLKHYDVIISDFSRDDTLHDSDGLKFADFTKSLDYSAPIIFFTSSYDEKVNGIPSSIFAVAHRPDYLINYVLDAIERGGTPFPNGKYP